MVFAMRFARKNRANPSGGGGPLVSVPKEESEDQDQETLVIQTLCGVGGDFFCSNIVRNQKKSPPTPYVKGCGKGRTDFENLFSFLTPPILAIGG
jgi:hypothetical protein